MLYGLEGWPMPPALDERVETPTHRSRRTHQRTGAGEQKCPILTAHFMAFIGAGAAAFAFRMAFVATNACAFAVLLTAFIAFIAAARMAFVGTIACLVAFRTAFMAFIAAARIAFAMTRRERLQRHH